MKIDEALEKISEALNGWDGKTDTVEIDPLPIIVLFLDWQKTQGYLAVSMNLTQSVLDQFSKSNRDIREVLHS